MLAEESAGLLYHLLVLWSGQGLEPKKVWQALDERRKG
ncbi:MAG: phosphoribosyl-ATP pyrophosphatase [Alphaproteobacteria bacterium]